MRPHKNHHDMKVEALNNKQINKIIYALNLAYGDSDSWDDEAMQMLEDIQSADHVCIANNETKKNKKTRK